MFFDYLYTPEELEPIADSIKSMAKKVEREPSRREAKKVIAAQTITTRPQRPGTLSINVPFQARLASLAT
jgi:hypothetical protein